MGNAAGQKVLVVRGDDLGRAHAFHELGAGDEMLPEIGGGEHAPEDTDPSRLLLREVARLFQDLPGDLEEEPVLGVHHLRLLRGNAEEGGVEHLHVAQDAPGPDVRGVLGQARGEARVELLGLEEGDRFDAVAQVLPQLAHARRAREPPPHADDGHVVEADVGGAALADAPGLRGRARRASVDSRRHRFHGRVLEEADHRHVDLLLVPHASQELEGQKRVAAELEEVVADAHAPDAQDVLEQRHQVLLRGSSGGHELPLEVGAIRGGCGQPALVHLPVGGEGQGLHPHERRGDHELGHAGGQELAEDRGPWRILALSGDEVAHQALDAGAILPGCDHGGLHRRVLVQGLLDLPRLDPEAADLHLLVRAAAELQDPFGAPVDEVAGSVEPSSRCAEGVGDEALGVELGTSPVARGDAGSADPQLSQDAGGHRLHALVEHVDSGVADGLPDGDREGPFGQVPGDHVGRGDDGAHGRAEGVGDSQVGQGGVRSSHVCRRHGFTAHQHVTHSPKTARVLIDHRVEYRGAHDHGVQAVAFDRGGEASGGGDPLGIDEQSPAVQEHGPDLEDGGVEGEGQHVKPRRLGAEVHIVDGPHQPVHAPVRDLGALRRPGRARGIDDVGETLRGGRALWRGGILRAQPLGQILEHQDPRLLALHTLGQPAVGQDERGVGVFENEAEPLGGMRRVEGEVGSPRLENAEECDRDVLVSLQAEAHHRLQPHPETLKVTGQLAGPRVELGVRERPVVGDDGQRVGPLRDVLGKEVGDGGLGTVVDRRAIPFDQQPLSLPLVEEVDFSEGDRRVRDQALQCPVQVVEEPG